MSRPVITLRDLVPRQFDLVIVFWERLLQWAKQKDVIVSGSDARVTETSSGTSVVYEPKFPWDHPFRGSVSGRRVTVRPGFVDDEMPTIDGIALDGRDDEGNENPAPIFEIPEDAEPGEDGRSFLCLRILYDVEGGQFLEEEDDWLTLEHVADLDKARKDYGPAAALEPLFILYWDKDGRTILRSRQDVVHNLKHHFLPGDGEGTGRHFFSAV